VSAHLRTSNRCGSNSVQSTKSSIDRGIEPGGRLLRSLEGVERTRVLGIHGRDMVDLQACVKSLTTGFLPDVSSVSSLLDTTSVAPQDRKLSRADTGQERIDRVG
jgi:hypothetical protein